MFFRLHSLLSATPTSHLAGLLSRADAYFSGSSIRSLWVVMEWVRHSTNVQKRSFAIAIVYNVAVLFICFMGWMTALLAAIAMPISSIAIVSDVYHQQAQFRPDLEI